MHGVSTLSGYTTTADGEPLAFSMMMEHFVVPTSKIREIQDRIGVIISGFHH
ncbi:MAG: D-alanyl-D-alanine carboxypeptidase [bacterium]